MSGIPRWEQMRIRSLTAAFVAFLVILTGLAGVTGVSPATAANPSPPKIVFPVAKQDVEGLRWSDTWGAPRSGGRTHIGVDLLGNKMLKLVAARDSTVVWGRFDNSRGTIVKLRDSDGWEYQYIHINNDTPGTDNGQATCAEALSTKLCAAREGSKLAKGTEVTAGEFIGYLGDSGNAEWTPPHLHFEIYRPDGQPVNPTSYVDEAYERLVSGGQQPEREFDSASDHDHDHEPQDEPQPESESGAKRKAARQELSSDAAKAADKLSIRLNGRKATKAERTAITGAVESEGLGLVIADLVESNPAVAMVDRLYLTFFQRHPDPEGLEYWLELVGDGSDLEEVAEWFAMSEEYQRRYAGRDFSQFLDQLYVDVLNRQPDESGKAYWLDQLNDGAVNRGTIVVYFTEGEELIRAHKSRTELSVAHQALGLDRPTSTQVGEWAATRQNKSLVEALDAWLKA